MVYKQKKSILLLSQGVFFILFVLTAIWYISQQFESFSLLPRITEFIPVFLFLIFLALSGYIKFRNKEALELQRTVAALIESTAKGKILTYKQDFGKTLLVILELLFMSVIAVALTAYLDPDFNIIEWETIGEKEPMKSTLAFARIESQGIPYPYSVILSGILFLLVLTFIRYLWNNAKIAYDSQKRN